MQKRGLEFSFAWLFAIIAGAVIIFLAIYAVTSLIRTERTSVDAQTAKQLGILLNPVETSLESAKTAQINFPSETRIYNSCSTQGNFGRQGISASASSGIGEKFQQPTTESIFFNKYLFSPSTLQGKSLYLFAKPFEMPYKTADLIFAWTDEYCFISPFADIEEEISQLNLKKITINNSIEECPKNSIKVCFNSQNNKCNIVIDSQQQIVNKQGKTLYYHDALLYGAIFSDPEIYECQIQRLAKRTAELASLYAGKTEFLSTRNCPSTLQAELINYAEQLSSIKNSQQLSSISLLSEEIRRKNNALTCKLF